MSVKAPTFFIALAIVAVALGAQFLPTSAQANLAPTRCFDFYFEYTDGHIDQADNLCMDGMNVTKSIYPPLHVNVLHISCSDTFQGGVSDGASDLAGHTISQWWIVREGNGGDCGNIPPFTPTPTASRTPTSTHTFTPTNTPTPTNTFTPTNTPTNTPTPTPTFTSTNTDTPTATFTATNTNTPVFSPTITPTIFGSTCVDFGLGPYSIKIEPVSSGTYDLGGGESVNISVHGRTFDWTATIGVNGVIVKGGPGENVYTYNPAVTSDSGLHAPINPSNGQPFGLSNVIFCFGTQVATSTPSNTPTLTNTATATNTPVTSYTPTWTPTNTSLPSQTPTSDGGLSCVDLGLGPIAKKIEPVSSGTYDLGNGYSLTITVSGKVFDWTATLGINGVIVKGGSGASIYYYSPPATFDSGLHAPINPNNGQPYGLSNVIFCYGYPTPTPTVTNTPTFTATFTASNTPTPTYTPTHTPTFTATFTPTNTPIVSHTPTKTPTRTPTSDGGLSCVTFGLGPNAKKFEPVASGTYDLGNGYTVTIARYGSYFDWSATLGINGVIVKGGPSTTIYYYNPPATFDFGLHAPINPNNGQPYGLSNVTFCYAYPTP